MQMGHVKYVHLEVAVLSIQFRIFAFTTAKISLNTPAHWLKCVTVSIVQTRQLKRKAVKSLSQG